MSDLASRVARSPLWWTTVALFQLHSSQKMLADKNWLFFLSLPLSAYFIIRAIRAMKEQCK